jgi:hypothetical protein
MPVRKTESRIPANYQAADLGEAVVSGDGRCAMVSFITSPLVINRDNVYVAFVTDAGLAASVHTFEWTVTEGGGTPVTQTTAFGEFTYRPQTAGSFNIAVRFLDAGNTELAKLQLSQNIVELNAALESMISGASNDAGPTVPSPDVARELVNDHNPYYQAVTLEHSETGDAFRSFIFSMVFDGALLRTPERRKQALDQLAASLNSQGDDFGTLAAEGVGVCGIRLGLLGMVWGSLGPVLPWTELPEQASQRAVADEQLRESLAALDENTKIDLFNLVRFPKCNITQCGRIIETLRDKYFAGTNFNDVLTGISGTRAHWIVRHFREGPINRV